MDNKAQSPRNLPPFAALIDTPSRYGIYQVHNSSPKPQSKYFYEPKPNVSPRSKLISLRSRSQKLPIQQIDNFPSVDNHLNSTNDLINKLENEDFLKVDWSRIFNSNENCLVDPERIQSNLSPGENKLFQRGNPMVFPTERHFSIFLANRMSDALDGINQRLPTHYEKETYEKEDLQYIHSQLDVYFTVLGECIKEMSTHSRSLALLTHFVNGRILDICRKSLKTMQTRPETPKNEIKIEEKPLIIDNSKDEKIEQLQSQLKILQKEFDKCKEDLDRQNYETFALKSQVSQNNKKINSLLKVNQSLRDLMAESKHKLLTEKQQNSKPNSNISIASVPKDVFTVWDEVSQFSQFVLQGNLMKLDVNKIFPQNPTKSSTLPPNFTFQKEQTEFKEGIYYSNFFTDIKNKIG